MKYLILIYGGKIGLLGLTVFLWAELAVQIAREKAGMAAFLSPFAALTLLACLVIFAEWAGFIDNTPS